MTRWAVLGAVLALPVLAADPAVSVQADVVYASTQAGTVDPSLEKIRAAMAAKVKYATMKKLDSKKLELKLNQLQRLTLPNQKVAELTLQDVKDNVATLKLRVPPTEAVYSLGRDKSLFVQGGTHDGGDLWVVLSQPK